MSDEIKTFSEQKEAQEIMELQKMAKAIVLPTMPEQYKDRPYKDIISEALVQFFLFKIGKLYDAIIFQEELRETLRARIPEADFRDIQALLEQEETTTGKEMQGVLIPFLEKVTAMQNSTAKETNNLAETASSETLQGLNELSMILDSLKQLSTKMDTAKVKDFLKKDIPDNVKSSIDS